MYCEGVHIHGHSHDHLAQGGIAAAALKDRHWDVLQRVYVLPVSSFINATFDFMNTCRCNGFLKCYFGTNLVLLRKTKEN